ncbi:hypothetical protein BDK51DRAFT_32606 [Blyttiomyces helicus]|uniref:Uncharacterized protein n=1 Tax=Blyttiomyces helicus TaxID=388810 RepID=A0A4P9W1L0_9FUNG|nr:hypothetical protein BDK51DRAFT_32606 [Blyttiomyces helicus]|eukprot:RKO85043.1 hypothetical protein BDK51DRAFT_32606 [Blyttiomyces helicus]
MSSSRIFPPNDGSTTRHGCRRCLMSGKEVRAGTIVATTTDQHIRGRGRGSDMGYKLFTESGGKDDVRARSSIQGAGLVVLFVVELGGKNKISGSSENVHASRATKIESVGDSEIMVLTHPPTLVGRRGNAAGCCLVVFGDTVTAKFKSGAAVYRDEKRAVEHAATRIESVGDSRESWGGEDDGNPPTRSGRTESEAVMGMIEMGSQVVGKKQCLQFGHGGKNNGQPRPTHSPSLATEGMAQGAGWLCYFRVTQNTMDENGGLGEKKTGWQGRWERGYDPNRLATARIMVIRTMTTPSGPSSHLFGMEPEDGR